MITIWQTLSLGWILWLMLVAVVADAEDCDMSRAGVGRKIAGAFSIMILTVLAIGGLHQ